MQTPGEDDLRWYQDVQGVIEASVVNTPRAFYTVHAEVHDGQILTPVSISMDGPDLPPPNAWREALSERGADRARIRIPANGRPVFRPQGYMIPLVSIAWMNPGWEEHQAGIEPKETAQRRGSPGWVCLLSCVISIDRDFEPSINRRVSSSIYARLTSQWNHEMEGFLSNQFSWKKHTLFVVLRDC